jgi:hypothetical protein
MSTLTKDSRHGGRRRAASVADRGRRGDGDQLRLGQAAPAPEAVPASLISDRVARERADVVTDRPGGGLTFDDVLVGAWEGLSAHRMVPCPVCDGAMAPRFGAGHGAVGGRCASCGTAMG